MFVHRSFPAQFGHLAARLASVHGLECTFVSKDVPEVPPPYRHIAYRTARDSRYAEYLVQDIAYETRHAIGVYEALKERGAGLRPDVIVGHAGFGTTLFLPELYPGTPIVDYFEYFHHTRGSAIDFRPDRPPTERSLLRHRLQNAGILVHLEQCTAGYTPTRWQHGLLPTAYRPKIRVVHDGIDTGFWRPSDRSRAGAAETRVVTYVSRGLESLRGFDVFMQVAQRVIERFRNVVFLVIGSDEVIYGSDVDAASRRSFKDQVLASDDYDLDRIRFLGWVPRDQLVRLLNLSDLHIYLTTPFPLSWSLLNAMACGCTVLASDTEPVREVVHDGANGMLRGFFDVDGFVDAALDVLRDPASYRELGEAATRTVAERYSLETTTPQLLSLLDEVCAGRTATPAEPLVAARPERT